MDAIEVADRQRDWRGGGRRQAAKDTHKRTSCNKTLNYINETPTQPDESAR